MVLIDRWETRKILWLEYEMFPIVSCVEEQTPAGDTFWEVLQFYQWVLVEIRGRPSRSTPCPDFFQSVIFSFLPIRRRRNCHNEVLALPRPKTMGSDALELKSLILQDKVSLLFLNMFVPQVIVTVLNILVKRYMYAIIR